MLIRIALGAVLASPACALADVYRWINPNGGQFNDPANWNRGGVPGIDDLALFDLAGIYTVTFTEGAATSIEITTGIVTFELNGVTLALGEGQDEALVINRSATPGAGASLVVRHGALDLHSWSYIGPDAAMVAEDVVVDTSFTSQSLGVAGTAMLVESEFTGKVSMLGGTLNLEDSTLTTTWLLCNTPSSVRLQGPEARLFASALSIQGELHVLHGARIQSQGDHPAILHLSPASMHIDGPGSTVTAVGAAYQGSTLTVSRGGEFRFPGGFETHAATSVGPGAALRGQNLWCYTAPSLSFDATVECSELNLLEGLTIELDGRSTRATPLFDISTKLLIDDRPLFVSFRNTNALAVGRVFPLVAPDTWLAGNFSSLSTPPLDGGRVLRIHQTPSAAPMSLSIDQGLPSCYSPDFDADGHLDADDIAAFFACVAGNCCPTCPTTADFNGDGDIATDADIEAFFRVLAGGSC